MTRCVHQYYPQSYKLYTAELSIELQTWYTSTTHRATNSKHHFYPQSYKLCTAVLPKELQTMYTSSTHKATRCEQNFRHQVDPVVYRSTTHRDTNCVHEYYPQSSKLCTSVLPTELQTSPKSGTAAVCIATGKQPIHSSFVCLK